jgi:hypothetical protein
MHHRALAALLVALQKASDLARRDPQLLGRLGLPDAPGLQIPKYYQPVSIPLAHGENSLFLHLPSLTPSTGHFYLAQTGHSHLAPTRERTEFDPLHRLR